MRKADQIVTSTDQYENSPFSKPQREFLRPPALAAESVMLSNVCTTSHLGAANVTVNVTVLPERDGRDPKGVSAVQKGMSVPPPPPPLLKAAPPSVLSSIASGAHKSSNRKGLVRPTSQMCSIAADTRIEAKRATYPVRIEPNTEIQDTRSESGRDQKGSYESRDVCGDAGSGVTNAESRSLEVDSSVVSVGASGAVPSSSDRPKRRTSECMENPSTASSIDKKGSKVAEKALDTSAGVGAADIRQGLDRDRIEHTVTRTSLAVPVISITVADSIEPNCNETVVSVNSSQTSLISTHKEENLSDAEFEQLFEMTREQWAVLPKWQQTRRKKLVGLF